MMENYDTTENNNDLGIPLDEFDFEGYPDESGESNAKLGDTLENDLYLDDDYKEQDLPIEGDTLENTADNLVQTQEDAHQYSEGKEEGHIPLEGKEDENTPVFSTQDFLDDNNISLDYNGKDPESSKENDHGTLDQVKKNEIPKKDDQKVELTQGDMEYYDEENEQGLDYLEENRDVFDPQGNMTSEQVALTQEDMLSDYDIRSTNDNESETSEKEVVEIASDMPVKKTYSRKEKVDQVDENEESIFRDEEFNYPDYNRHENESRNGMPESAIHAQAEDDLNSNMEEDERNSAEKVSDENLPELINDKETGVVEKNKPNVVLSQDDMLEDEVLDMLNDEEFLDNVDKNGDKPDDGFLNDNFENEAVGNENNKQHIDLSSQDMLDGTKIPESDDYFKEAEKKKRRPYDDITKPQDAFQPGSTPMKNHRQYLVVNSVGSITTMEHETFSTITVEYYDQSYNRGYNLRDEFNYSMACLDANGALYATESVKASTGESNPSILFYKPRETWASKSEWMLTLPPEEDITAIALGSEGIIASTSKDILRFFSLCGVQTYIFNLSSVVSMVARNEFALIVYSMGIGYKGSQNLGYILYNFRNREILQKDRIPISKESILQWIGFSEEGMPAMFDSKGVLSILHHYRTNNQGRWIPILDTSLNRKEEEKDWAYWPVSLNENKLICFICKNGEQHPSIPRPSFDEINLQVPLLNLDKKDGQYEEKIMRMSVITRFEFDEAKARNSLEWEREKIKQKKKEINDTLLELIMLACQEERLQRALDLAKLLSTTKSLDKAIKIANFKKFPKLAEKINQIKSNKIAEMHREQMMISPSPFRTQSQTLDHTRTPRSPTLNAPSYRQNLSNAPDISGGYDSLTFGNEDDNDLMINTSSTSSNNDIPTGSKRRAQEIDYDDLYYDESPKVKKVADQLGIKKNPFRQKPNDPIINPFAVSNEPNTDEESETKKAKTTKESGKKVGPKRQAKLGEHFGSVIKETESGQNEEQDVESTNPVTEPGPETYDIEVDEEQREIVVIEEQKENDDTVLDTGFTDKDIEEFGNDFEGDPTESQDFMDFDVEQNSVDYEQDSLADLEEV